MAPRGKQSCPQRLARGRDIPVKVGGRRHLGLCYGCPPVQRKGLVLMAPSSCWCSAGPGYCWSTAWAVVQAQEEAVDLHMAFPNLQAWQLLLGLNHSISQKGHHKNVFACASVVTKADLQGGIRSAVSRVPAPTSSLGPRPGASMAELAGGLGATLVCTSLAMGTCICGMLGGMVVTPTLLKLWLSSLTL